MKVVLTLHKILYRLRLWIPATPTVKMWDKDMNYVATLQHSKPAHFGWRR